MNSEQTSEKVLQGVVVSNSMDKTVVVAIARKEKHKKYGKYIKRVTKCYAHDDNNACKIGDTIKIVATRPLSKLKRWKVVSEENSGAVI